MTASGPPLVADSPVARALYELMSGQQVVELNPGDDITAERAAFEVISHLMRHSQLGATMATIAVPGGTGAQHGARRIAQEFRGLGWPAVSVTKDFGDNPGLIVHLTPPYAGQWHDIELRPYSAFEGVVPVNDLLVLTPIAARYLAGKGFAPHTRQVLYASRHIERGLVDAAIGRDFLDEPFGVPPAEVILAGAPR